MRRALVPLAGSSAGGCCDSMAALGDRGAGAGFGVKPRENEEGRGGVAAPRSGAKRRPDFWRAALVDCPNPRWDEAAADRQARAQIHIVATNVHGSQGTALLFGINTRVTGSGLAECGM